MKKTYISPESIVVKMKPRKILMVSVSDTQAASDAVVGARGFDVDDEDF